MDDRRRALVERYKRGYDAIVDALRGAADAELDVRPPGDREFTAREVVHHVADSEMTSAIRLRRLIAEERPAISGYDEWGFAGRLRYASRPIEPALLAIRAARETTAQILERLTPEEWDREGTHGEMGRYRVDDWLDVYAAHAHEHAEQIGRALAHARRAR
ncbi:MAG TPA: DinB family protein [Candidatus Limnocylindria bacterium]|nr:DinB family protein [Candidatus Limnocylindria bacterium]